MQPRWVVPALAALLLIVVPSASACSLARVPPEPGAFFLWNPTDEETHAVPVDGRELGAGCELSNPFGLTHERLAYASSNHGSQTARVLVHNLTTNQTTRIDTQAERITDVSLFEDAVLALEERYEEDRELSVHLHGLEEESSRRLPVDASQRSQIVLEGALVIVLDRGEDARLSVYDAREDAWRFEDRGLEDPAVPEHPGIRAASQRWLLFGLDDPGLYDLEGEQAHEFTLPNGASPVGIDEARLFYATREDGEHILWRVDLPDGNHQRVGAAQHDPLGASAGWVVLGAYSAPNVSEEGGPFVEAANPVPAPGPYLAAGMIGLAAALWGRRS